MADKLVGDGIRDGDEALVAFIAAAIAAMNLEDEHRRRRSWQRGGSFRETAFRQPIGTSRPRRS